MFTLNIYDSDNGYTGRFQQRHITTPLSISLLVYERTLCPLLEKGQKIDFISFDAIRNYNMYKKNNTFNEQPYNEEEGGEL